MRLFPIYTWNKGIRNFDHRRSQFTHQPWAQGVILLSCVVVAMLRSAQYLKRMDEYAGIASSSGGFPNGPQRHFLRKALMPVIAAFGGVVVPALIYTLVNHGTAASSGWGIPTATDIAFAVGILSILGDRVPVSLKVFLTALAIADDLIAILVVALFYGGHINFVLLGIAVLLIVVGLLVNRLGEKHVFNYVVPWIIIWGLFYYAGIHSTMSGVVIGAHSISSGWMSMRASPPHRAASRTGRSATSCASCPPSPTDRWACPTGWSMRSVPG